MSTGDNLLRSGWSGLEHLSDPGRKNALNADQGQLYHKVEPDRSDEYDSYVLVVTGQLMLLAEADSFRTMLKVRLLSGPNVVIGKMSKVQARTGYLLVANAELEVKTGGQIFVGPEGGPSNTNPTYLSVWVERDNEVG